MTRKKPSSSGNKNAPRKKVTSSPVGEANSLFQQGGEFHRSGQLSLAESAYRRSITLNPSFPGSHNNLGNVLKDQGKHRLAEKSYRRALELAPGHPMLLSNIGNVLHLQKQYPEAEKYLNQAIHKEPKHFEALVNLGNVLMALRRRGEAVKNYLKAFELNDSVPELLANLGMVLSEDSQHLPASQFLKKAVRLAPEDASYRLRLGYSLARIGQAQQAEFELSEAMRLAPEEPRARMHYADVLAKQGRVGEAVDQLQAAISLDDTFADAHQLLAEYKPDAADLPRMESLYRRKDLLISKRMSLAFGLGAGYEAQRDYEGAFGWFAKANALSRQLADLGTTPLTESYRRIVDLYSKDPLPISNGDDEGYQDATPIIIAGTSRSGKSLVEKLLCCHETVSPRGETGVFVQLVQRLSSNRDSFDFYDTLRNLSPGAMRALGQEYVTQLRTDEEMQPHLTDTTPGNTMFIGLLRQCLPKAKIIICRRNARDACVMMYKKKYVFQNHYSEDLVELGDYWASHSRMLDLWLRLFPDHVYEVSFERLVTSPEPEAQALLDFCGLPADSVFAEKLRQLISDSGRWPAPEKVIGVWKPYEAYLTPLIGVLDGS